MQSGLTFQMAKFTKIQRILFAICDMYVVCHLGNSNYSVDGFAILISPFMTNIVIDVL